MLLANMADHLVGTLDKLHEREVSEASVSCFDNTSTEKFCFVVDLVCCNSPCLRDFAE